MATKKKGSSVTAKRTKSAAKGSLERTSGRSSKVADQRTIRIPGTIAGGPGCKVSVKPGRVVRNIVVKKETGSDEIVLTLRFKK